MFPQISSLLCIVYLGVPIFFLWFVSKFIRPRNCEKSIRYPPGPFRLPIIGNLHQLGKEPFKSFIKLGKKHGVIISLKLGSQSAIVLNNYLDIRDAFALPSLTGRVTWHDSMAHCGGQPRGIVFNQGNSWQVQRRFGLRTLRDLGFEKTTAEEIILTEAVEVVDFLKEKVGQAVFCPDFLNVAVANVIWTLVRGERMSHDDPVLAELLHNMEELVRTGHQVSAVIFFPWIKYFRRIIPNSCGKVQDVLRGRMRDMMAKFVEDHIKNYPFDESLLAHSDSISFIDSYLREIKRTSDPTSSFYGEEGFENLKTVLFDLFAAGSETSATTLHWMCILMAIYPEIQEKLHAEIRSVIGLGRLPALKDKAEMPYTEAVIAEVTRFMPLLPLGVPHTAVEDTHFKGYFIPKDTIIIANTFAAHSDPSVWGDPEKFRPERFLSRDEDGSLKFVRNNEALLTFSTGKRLCLGMNLAQDELFLFTTSIFQRFRLGPMPNGEKPSFEYTATTVIVPVPQKIMVADRFSEIA